jgi:replicative DNA helicase
LVERTSEIARGVKQLAKNLGAVVLLIAQTSRHAGDGSEEVTVTDARDSGAIEDSADFLIGCWRPELKTGLTPEGFREVKGQLWFRILKARRGMQARFCAKFDGPTLRVLESAPERVTVP